MDPAVEVVEEWSAKIASMEAKKRLALRRFKELVGRPAVEVRVGYLEDFQAAMEALELARQ